MTILITLLVYFGVLLVLSRLTTRHSSNDTFYRGNRQSPWPLVAFGMVGASISGVTFISVPGMAVTTQFTYLQMCLGFAVGYVVVALLFVYTSWRTQLAVVASCMVAYVAVFAIWGQMDFTIDANICEEIDRQVLGRWRDGVIWNGDQWQWDATYHYTWILSSLNFVGTVYLGYLAGVVLRTSQSGTSKLRILLLSGIGLIVFAFALSPVVPIIKHIWSTSMTFFAGGICFLLMAAAYYWVDLKGHTRGLMWLRFYGTNSLVAYVLGEYVNFSSLTDSLFYGFKPLLGAFYPVLGATMQGIFVLLVLRWMYKSNIFVKA